MGISIRVIKIGGSLLGRIELASAVEHWAGKLDATFDAVNIWLVGGGAAVDVIRDLDLSHPLPTELTHRASIRMMDVNASMLALHFPGWEIVNSLGEIESAKTRLLKTSRDGLEAGRSFNLLLQPSLVLCELERVDADLLENLPASWRVTSDSIAAWIGLKLGAFEVVLLKSCGVPGDDLKQWRAAGVVDDYLSALPIDFRKLKLKCETLIGKTV